MPFEVPSRSNKRHPLNAVGREDLESELLARLQIQL